jgi:hypothetical protein
VPSRQWPIPRSTAMRPPVPKLRRASSPVARRSGALRLVSPNHRPPQFRRGGDQRTHSSLCSHRLGSAKGRYRHLPTIHQGFSSRQLHNLPSTCSRKSLKSLWHIVCRRPRYRSQRSLRLCARYRPDNRQIKRRKRRRQGPRRWGGPLRSCRCLETGPHCIQTQSLMRCPRTARQHSSGES